MEEIEKVGMEQTQAFNEEFTAYSTTTGSRSGIYIFNPRTEQMKVTFDNSMQMLYELPDMLSILQVHLFNRDTVALKTYSIVHGISSPLNSQVNLVVDFHSTEYIEASYKLDWINNKSTSKFKVYADDSMKLVERRIYDPEFNLTTINDIEKMGYFTSSCVHGGILQEIESDQQQWFLGWANSNSIGCTFSDNNQVEIMLFRNIGK